MQDSWSNHPAAPPNLFIHIYKLLLFGFKPVKAAPRKLSSLDKEEYRPEPGRWLDLLARQLSSFRTQKPPLPDRLKRRSDFPLLLWEFLSRRYRSLIFHIVYLFCDSCSLERFLANAYGKNARHNLLSARVVIDSAS